MDEGGVKSVVMSQPVAHGSRNGDNGVRAPGKEPTSEARRVTQRPNHVGMQDQPRAACQPDAEDGDDIISARVGMNDVYGLRAYELREAPRRREIAAVADLEGQSRNAARAAPSVEKTAWRAGELNRDAARPERGGQFHRVALDAPVAACTGEKQNAGRSLVGGGSDGIK